MTPYEPAASPRGKPGSEVLFFESTSRPEFEGVRRLGQRLRETFGPDRVVFGVKAREGLPVWEFYFYRHADPGLEFARGREALSPFLDLPALRAPVPAPFLWSFEAAPVSAPAQEALPIHLYFGTQRNKRRFGRSFLWDGERLSHENDYSFYRLPDDRDPLNRALRRCVEEPAGAPAERLLPPEMMDAGCVCVARKRRGGRLPKTANSLYFSGLRLSGFRSFLSRSGLDAALLRFVDAESGRLDHLLYDVGIDFEAEPGRLHVLKSGFYGVL